MKSINTSGHKYGGVLPGVGWVLWREQSALPEELRFNVNYLGGEMPTIGMNFSRPGAQVVGQYFNFLHLGRSGYAHRMAALEAIACRLADGIAAMPQFRLISHPMGQLPVFAVELDQTVTGWTVFQLSDKLRERGWLIPAYTMPADCEQMAVLRFVIRAGLAGTWPNNYSQTFNVPCSGLRASPAPCPNPSRPSSISTTRPYEVSTPCIHP